MSEKALTEMTSDELKAELLELRREQFNLRMQKGMEEGPKPHQFGRVKRSIARVKTAIRQLEVK